MSVDSVRAFLAEKAPDISVIELALSTATVALAAEGHGVSVAEIAKTLSLRVGSRNFLVVTRGDARLDNKKAKAAFGGKASMLDAEAVLAVTGHPVGGVCPFGLATPLPVYCDVSLKEFAEVVPAAGSTSGRVIVPSLPLPESGRISTELLARLQRGYCTPAELLAARAVEVAERIGTPEAKKLLAAWADGAPLATLTVEAKAALARMK